jgi:hypothetical protein
MEERNQDLIKRRSLYNKVKSESSPAQTGLAISLSSGIGRSTCCGTLLIQNADIDWFPAWFTHVHHKILPLSLQYTQGAKKSYHINSQVRHTWVFYSLCISLSCPRWKFLTSFCARPLPYFSQNKNHFFNKIK